MAKCDRCSDELHDYQWSLRPKGNYEIEKVCLTCMMKETFPEMKDSKYLKQDDAQAENGE